MIRNCICEQEDGTSLIDDFKEWEALRLRLRAAGLNATTLAELDQAQPADKLRLGRKLLPVVDEINRRQKRKVLALHYRTDAGTCNECDKSATAPCTNHPCDTAKAAGAKR